MSVIKKSRTFAVVIPIKTGAHVGTLQVHLLFKKSLPIQPVEAHGGDSIHSLNYETANIIAMQGDVVMLLVKAGLTVRTYDPEEKQWMDQSKNYGVVRAPGQRDGTWGLPTLEEFEINYLNVT